MSQPSPLIQKVEQTFHRAVTLPEFRVGDTLKVWVKIREGEKERLQAFEGIVIARKRGSARGSFTVRKVSYGVGVERVFAEHSPNIDHIEVVSRGKVHQATLYYLRDLRGKAARIKERAYDASKDVADDKKAKHKKRGKHRKAAAKSKSE